MGMGLTWRVGVWRPLLWGCLVGTLVALLLAGTASALQSPVASVAAYDADGNPLAVDYYDRVGDAMTAGDYGNGIQTYVAYDPSPDGGPQPIFQFNSQPPDVIECDVSTPWPYSTAPLPQDVCWFMSVDPDISLRERTALSCRHR